MTHAQRTLALVVATSISLAWLPCAPAAGAPIPLSPAAVTPLALGQATPGSTKTKIKPKAAGAAKTPDAAAKKPDAADPAASPQAAGSEQAAAGGESFVSGLVRFIKTNAVWILVGLGVALAAVLAWALLSGKGNKGPAESAFAELGLAPEKPAAKPAKFSSTKIQASDVNHRLSGTMKTTEVETDREYALVVDEDALKKPPVPEDPATAGQVDPGVVRSLMEAKDLQGAYDEYLRQIEAHAGARFEADVEMKLGDGLMRSRDFARAARVLEHHVATQPRREISAETFFNLGYVHFVNKSFAKSRKYLGLFVEVEKNPVYIERARKILDRMKGSPAKN